MINKKIVAYLKKTEQAGFLANFSPSQLMQFLLSGHATLSGGLEK